jgi:hypothetical protein
MVKKVIKIVIACTFYGLCLYGALKFQWVL